MYMEFMLLTEGIVLFSEKKLYGKLYYWQKRFHQLMAPGYGHGSHTRPHSKYKIKPFLVEDLWGMKEDMSVLTAKASVTLWTIVDIVR